MEKNKYGNCSKCNSILTPIFFEETEYKILSNGGQVQTGRFRQAVSHLTCPYCLKNECVDNSFDGDWYYK